LVDVTRGPLPIGVVASQGDFEAHAAMLYDWDHQEEIDTETRDEWE
jgi:glutamine amidotransferase PdxT